MVKKRIDALTGIRFLAATMVFLYHNRKYWRTRIPLFELRFLNEFHTGVSLFFVLSGFLIAYTYQDYPMQSVKKYGGYLLVRCLRIFPVFLLLLTWQYVVDGFPATKEALLTYTLLSGFSDVYNLSGIPQAWSLTLEMSFYTLAPLIYLLTKKSIKITMLFFAGHLLLFWLIGYGWNAFNGNHDKFFWSLNFIITNTFSGRFFEFFAGVLLAISINSGGWLNNWKFKTWMGGVSALLIIYIISLFEVDIYHHGTETTTGLLIRNFIFPLAIAVFIAGLITEDTLLKRLFQTKLLVLLGNASFVFYLIHIGFVNLHLRRLHLFPDRNFILLWIISVLIYVVIEKPLYIFLRKKIT